MNEGYYASIVCMERDENLGGRVLIVLSSKEEWRLCGVVRSGGVVEGLGLLLWRILEEEG